MSESGYDIIVVGAGSMGMSAGYELARRGFRVLLLDAFDPPHGEGSHHGEPRLIRHVYHGGGAYVDLAQRADERWLELEDASGEKLLERSGVINIADPAVHSYEDRLKVADERGVPYELLEAGEIRRRWPGLALPDSFCGMYEPGAGYLYSEKCIAAYRKLALAAGAKLVTGATVTRIETDAGGVAVHTAGGVHRAGKAMLSAGAWFETLQPFVRLPIRAVRKTVGWFRTEGGLFDAGAFPGFTLGTELGGFYGFPSIGGRGLKIGRHDGGREWRPGGKEPAPFGFYPEDEDDLRAALEAFMPKASGPLLKGVACKYELTPDEHFIIDHHPEFRHVVIVGGFSGHGFKFASVVGEIAADLLEKGRSGQDLRMFSLSRFDDGGRSDSPPRERENVHSIRKGSA